MQTVTRQLAWVRQRARAMLIAQRLCEAVAVLGALAIVLGLIDFVLRLPGWLRGVMTVLVIAAAGMWLTTRLLRAIRFRPTLSELALRAERLYPELAGVLASGVEFSLHEQAFADPKRTASLAQASLKQASEKLAGVDLKQLIDSRRTTHTAMAAMTVLAVVVSIIFGAPAAASTAAQRWLLPWNDAQWPLRTDVETATAEAVWPTDTPLRLRAQVVRGHRSGLRVHVQYQVLDGQGAAGRWEDLLMNAQPSEEAGAHYYERLVDVPLPRSTTTNGQPTEVAYRFWADDDVTPVYRMQLVARPTVEQVVAAFEPAVYGAGLLSSQVVSLHEQSSAVASTSAMAGSQVRLTVTFNKVLPTSLTSIADVLPGLAEVVQLVEGDGDEDAGRRSMVVAFELDRTVETAVRLTDEHGLSNLSERRYRIEVVEDRPPAVSMTEPGSDESVLATAVVQVAALGQDDVGMEQVSLRAQVPGAGTGAGASDSPATASMLEVAQQTGRQPSLTVSAPFDLQPLALKPGDEVVLTAVGQDVFDWRGQRHEPVRSAARRLRIIDDTTLIGQLRGELAGVRQQAIRLDETQRLLRDDEPEEAESRQGQITRRLETQANLVQRLQDRSQRNRLNEPALAELMQRSAKLIDEAEAASDAAQQALQQKDQAAATAAQEQVHDALTELVSLLDQGRDALTLQLQLRQLQTEQEAIALDTRQLLPQTVGRSAEQLPEALKQALKELAQRQAAAAEQAETLVRQMQSTAQALAEQESDRSQAAAEALAEAAALAEREGLSQQMAESSDSIQENQLAQAGQEQTDSLEVLQQMLQQMGTQQQRMQAILQRRLQELVQAIEQLIERQNQQLDALGRAEQVQPLEQGQQAVRRSTVATSEQARQREETADVAAELDRAVDDQGKAVLALRDSEAQMARLAEQTAVEHLTEALALARKQQEKAQQEQLAQQRQQLQAAYEKLADEQAALREQVQQKVNQQPMDRRQRAALVGLGHAESDIRTAAGELAAETDEVMMFQHLHRRIDEAARQATDQLRQMSADQQTLTAQQTVEQSLRMMAAALATDRKEAEFAGQTGDSGGGGGGAGGSQMQLVPPIAELKLLRQMQELVYEKTRSVQADGSAKMKQVLVDLSAQQRELAALGERLIEQLRQAQQQMQAEPR